MSDRAQQALHLLTLEPVAETLADQNSYGFRRHRSIQDAIKQCFILLSKKNAPKWILEGDIKGCFDKISHEWMLNNIPMDKAVLKQWLKAGYMEENAFHDTLEGTPQGGIASPVLANMTLDGLEKAVNSCSKHNVKFVRYADDFICTATSKECLEHEVLPVIIDFLKMRGLELSLEKTKITHIDDGFDFLGFNLRKYKNKLLIKPTKKGIECFLEKTRETIKTMLACKTSDLINKLNPMILGWANHYKHVVAKDTFSFIDNQIFSAIWKWAKRRHPNKSKSWIKNKYFTTRGLRNWCFFAHNSQDASKPYLLKFASETKITRYVKIRKEANPYDPKFRAYFSNRKKSTRIRRDKKRI
jgi:RNA-directed DNA polymerase